MKATIHEMGNGLPEVGDYVAGADGSATYLYRVESIDSRIQTSAKGSGGANWVFATVEQVDWSDCAEGDEFPARVVVPSAQR